MKFKDFFDIDILFHPHTFYDSNWFLNGEDALTGRVKKYLWLNSKKKKGINLYEQYLNKYYFIPLNKLFDSQNLAFSFEPEIILTVNDDGQKRITQFCITTYLMQLITSLNLVEDAIESFKNIINENIDRKSQLDKVKDIIHLEIKYYNDILNKSSSSKYYNKALDAYNLYSNHYNWEISFLEFINTQVYNLKKIMVGSRYYLDIFNVEINIKELIACFDYDTFCLLAAVSALDACYVTERIHNRVDSSAIYIKNYLDSVKKYQENYHNYNCNVIVDRTNKQKSVLVDINYVKKEFESLLARHPEFSFIEIEQEALSSLIKSYGNKDVELDKLDFSSKDGADLLDPIITKFIHDKELAASWEFIPKSIKQQNSTGNISLNISHTYLPKDEYIRRMIIGKNFLENSDYIYKLYGLNNFEGYIGYIYSSGSVIFEKYYENIKTKRIAKESATYVMSIYNFLELSRLSRMDIVRKLKGDSMLNVKRIFHNANMEKWRNEVNQAIMGNDYTEEVIEYINNLVKDNILTHDSQEKVKI